MNQLNLHGYKFDVPELLKYFTENEGAILEFLAAEYPAGDTEGVEDTLDVLGLTINDLPL